jgi:hypothetical protein
MTTLAFRIGMRSVATAALLASAVAMATPAHAAPQSIRFYSYGVGQPNPPHLTEVSTFNLDNPGTHPTNADKPTGAAGFTWSSSSLSTAGFIADATNGNGDEPASSPTKLFNGNYLDIEGGHAETLTFGPSISDRYVSIYVGSLDAYNEISFDLAGVANPVVFTGNGAGGTFSLDAVSHGDNGDPFASHTNGAFTFLFSSAIKSITFSSTENSFEIERICAAPTPEPSSWALMILGAGLAGGALRLGRRQASRHVAA